MYIFSDSVTGLVVGCGDIGSASKAFHGFQGEIGFSDFALGDRPTITTWLPRSQLLLVGTVVRSITGEPVIDP